MPTISDYFDYSILANAAYINLDGKSIDGATVASRANELGRIPTIFANALFDKASAEAQLLGESVWTISPGGYYGNDDTGFAATLFEKDGEKVLAIRGTEGGGTASDIYQDLLKEDLAQIGFIGFAFLGDDIINGGIENKSVSFTGKSK